MNEFRIDCELHVCRVPSGLISTLTQSLWKPTELVEFRRGTTNDTAAVESVSTSNNSLVAAGFLDFTKAMSKQLSVKGPIALSVHSGS
jgi:hypothetical protein